MKRFFVLTLLFLTTLCMSAQVVLLAHTAAGYGGTANGAAPVTTVAIDTTGAKMIAVCATGFAGNTSAPTDSAANHWRLANTHKQDGDSQVTLWYAIDPVTSKSHTFTAAGRAPALAVMAFSNVASGPDQQSSAEGQRSPLMVGSLTPANAGELAISCISASATGVTATINPPFTIVDALPYSGGYNGSVATVSAYTVLSEARKINPVWNFRDWYFGLGAVADTFFSTAAPAPLTVTTTLLEEGFAGREYRMQLEHSGGIGPYHWSLASGTLPQGLILSSSGEITGTPLTAISATPLSISVTDNAAHTVTSELSLTVATTELSAVAKPCVTTGKQYNAYGGCTIVARGGTPPYTYSWTVVTNASLAALPEGLSLDSATGAITGTVYGQGAYASQFEAKDSLGTIAKIKVKFSFAGDNTLGGCTLFPRDSIFHRNIANLPVDTSPAALVNPAYQNSRLRVFFGSGLVGATPNGIPFIRVPRNQPNVPVTTNLYQSYFSSAPVPAYAPVESTSNSVNDRHVLVLQTGGDGANCSLWEMWQGAYQGSSSGGWADSSNAHWANLGSNEMLPQGKGSTDAAGLPILPLLLNADEVIGTGTPGAPNGSVRHPTRFTVRHMLNNYVWPATEHAGTGGCKGGYEDRNRMLLQSDPPASCANSGPAGEIFRLKASVATPACAARSPQAAIIIEGFRNYGIILADNGLTGGLIGTPDSRWNDADLACLSSLNLGDFEPVNVSGIIVNATSSYQTTETPPAANTATPAAAAAQH